VRGGDQGAPGKRRDTAEGRVDRASRLVLASPSSVYRALIDPAARVRWLPPAGMRGRIDSFDARVGGGYRMTLTYEDPSESRGKSSDDADVVFARFVALVPDERVVEAVDFESADPAFAGTMTMSWVLAATGGGTEVSIVAEDVPSGIRPEDHVAGLQSSLANLSAYVERTEARASPM
jgi:uncharacterized protein YndB with AHSA1/START domain